MQRVLWVLALSACAVDPQDDYSVDSQPLTAAARKERAAFIRDSAAEMGVHNAALLGGIAVSETNFAHCWSEATYACKGPASPSCNGEPIIAGSADGPCVNMQGGLGMFQFDSGTYAQTVATYGDSILTVEGNTAQAVAFVIGRAIGTIDGVTDWESATTWLDSIPMDASQQLAKDWGAFLACRYNGCCSSSTTCVTRGNAYRDHAIELTSEFGAAFWKTDDRCAALPADGIIDQRSACYEAAGEPRYWRREAEGHLDTHEWTGTTTATKKANYGRWLVRSAGTFTVSAYVSGATATKASYTIVHGGTTDTVTIDQSTASGWVDLGMFAFTGEQDYVELGDNTGVADQELVFDAIRFAGDAVDPPPTGDDDDPTGAGGCSTGGGAGGLLLVLLAGVRGRRPRATA